MAPCGGRPPPERMPPPRGGPPGTLPFERLPPPHGLTAAPLPPDLGVLVLMLRVTRTGPRLLDVITHHRHDDVIRHATLARTIVVQNVTKPKLALLHQRSRKLPLAGNEMRKAGLILAELA